MGKLITLGFSDASLMLFDVEGNQKQRFPFVGFPGWRPLERKQIHDESR
jgi:hypothetical protein